MNPVLKEFRADTTPITIKYKHFKTHFNAVYELVTYDGPVASTHI